jgi:F-type H+-transporting ATPase subunit b
MAVLSIACLLLTLGVFYAPGLASEGAAEGGGHDSGRLTDLLYRFINFTLLLIILFVVIRKTAAKNFLATRREEIAKKMDDLQKEKEAAERRHRELEQKLKEFSAQKDEIIEQFRAEGVREKEKIIEEAGRRASQMLTQADLTIQREIQAARNRLRQQVVDAAARKAQDMISREIQESDHDQLVSDFIQKVEKLN